MSCVGWVVAIVKRNEMKNRRSFSEKNSLMHRIIPFLIPIPSSALNVDESYCLSHFHHELPFQSSTHHFPVSYSPHPTTTLPTHIKYLEQTNQYTPIKKQVKPPNLHIIQQMVKERLRHPSNRLIPMPIYSPTHPPPLRFRIKHCSTIRTRYGLHTINFSSTRSESKI